MNDPRFPDRFLPPRPDSDLATWARQEADQLPAVVLACLDPFTLRDRLTWFQHAQRDPDEGAAAALLLRAVLDRTVAWQTAAAARWAAGPERGPERGQEGGGER